MAELEGLLRAERNAQRDLKLVLAAAERQSQTDCSEKTDLASKWVHLLLKNSGSHKLISYRGYVPSPCIMPSPHLCSTRTCALPGLTGCT